MLSMRFGIFAFMFSSPILADESQHLEVTGRRYSWLDSVQTASEGQVDHEQLQQRPILRPAEILESVPGLITTQHSGTGKANQYFLRGFNLDHGTDFATFVDGIPINMPSHAHGQGYTDMNFLVPELLEQLTYSKGPYAADVGDFSGAGHIQLRTRDYFPQGLVQYTLGSYDYQRLLVLDSLTLGDKGQLSYALEGTRYQGPWSGIDERLRKGLGWLKWVLPTASGQKTLTAQVYEGSWTSADQIPSRAVEQGQLSRLGTVDPTGGGHTRRDSLSWEWKEKSADTSFAVQLYGVNYGLNLWSNFSYFMEDRENGDQLEQEDRRSIFGGAVSRSDAFELGSIPATLTLGLQSRYDNIWALGRYQTRARNRLSIAGQGSVREALSGIYLDQSLQWTSDFSTSLGLRHDRLEVSHRDRILQTKREAAAQITSPKFTARYRLDRASSFFASAGQSFHSNDARGITSISDPAPGLVPVRGYEVGAVHEREGLRLSLALWRLLLDSELIYIGDAGTTEAARASRRQGVDTLVQFAPSPMFRSELELSWAEARFREDPDGEGKRVEGHLPFVAMLGLGSQLNPFWSTDLRIRHFGRRPLTADGSQMSAPTTVVNLHLGYEKGYWEIGIDGLNALDTKAHDIDYFYESQLQDETEPSSDIHYHPVEPRSIRLRVGHRI